VNGGNEGEGDDGGWASYTYTKENDETFAIALSGVGG
jgi:hypothetical protein